MSQLLGRQDCIENIRGDLVDLQGAILDVFSRTGPVRSPSWKFPDKLACNLDMVALLDQYDFADGESAFNQHSHIVLLELVIDRLLLLLQSFSCYTEQLRCTRWREQTPQKRCLSIGLVVRNYWSNLLDFASLVVTVKDSNKQTKPKTGAWDETDTRSSTEIRHSSSSWSPSSSLNFLPQNYGSSHDSSSCPKAESHNVSSQTMESYLTPCNACQRVQSILKRTGDALVELCQSEGLPSSLQPLLAVVEDTLEPGQLTAGDLTQWANEQLRDLRRLEKHLQDVRATVQPLRERLAAAETERETFSSQLERAHSDFKQETQKLRATNAQLEFSLLKAQRFVKETEQRLQEEQQQLRRATLALEESNSGLNEMVAKQQETLQALEGEKRSLQEKVTLLHIKEEDCCQLQQRINALESCISETQVLLERENAKYQSACRQQESMQLKQTSLLETVDALHKESEELNRLLGEKEERHNELHDKLQHMSGEKEQLQAQLAQQQDSCLKLEKQKETLETDMAELKKDVAELREHVQALEERETLLVAFPELSPLAQACPQSTGNVLRDMEQQMQANSVRIKTLEQENTCLQSSLEKLRDSACLQFSRETSPQQSWNPSPAATPVKTQSDLTLIYNSPPSRGGARMGQCNRQRGRSVASPSSLSLRLQTLHLHPPHGGAADVAAAGKSQIKPRSASSLLTHSRGLKQRRK